MDRQLGRRKFLTVLIGASIAVFAPSLLSRVQFAQARMSVAECYRISTDSPVASTDSKTRSEIWCYKNVEKPAGARLVYNLDLSGRSKPELTLLVHSDGSVTHASLLNGKLSVHRLLAIDFNPIGAPLQPPAGAERITPSLAAMADDAADEGLKLFQEWGDIKLVAAKVSEGTVTIQADRLPWRGYWFPRSSGRLHNDDQQNKKLSPLAKYDAFIARRAADTNPGAQKWEKRNHGFHGVPWEGHCNGWAAASILSDEPKQPITDPYSGVSFSVSDLKGLLIERNYCPKLVMYGSRFDDEPNEDQRDIYASTFHNAITYFIGELKKPVLADVMSTRPVENSVISGYTMKTKKIGRNAYYVETTVTVHYYDKDPLEEPGDEPGQPRTYRYNLYTDDAGFVVSGSWISENPDFIWVPLAPATCAETNEVVDQFWIDEIFKMNPSPPPGR